MIVIAGLILAQAIVRSLASLAGVDLAATAKADRSSSPSTGHLGSVVTISGTASVICMPTKDGLDEIVRWVAAGDKNEAARTMLRGGGSFIDPGQTVKILDPGILHAEVRVISSGRECWAVPETIR